MNARADENSMLPRAHAFTTLRWVHIALPFFLATFAGIREVRADEGESALALNAVFAGAWLAHPGAGPSSSGALAFLPRAHLAGAYGLSNELALDVGFFAGASGNVATSDASVAGTTGTLLSGTYLELGMPVGLAFRFDSGAEMSGTVRVVGSPLLSAWLKNALVDPRRTDDAGLPRKFPVTVEDRLDLGAELSGEVLFDVRFFDVWRFSIGPFASAALAGAPSFRVGLSLSPSVVVPVTPL